jgi:Ca2+-binding RTX toxin-like protein
MANNLKPFVINLNDLAYLLAQVNFVPLFDASTNGNGIVGFDPAAMDAWDAKGNKVWDHLTHTGSYAGTPLTNANVSLLGSGFPQVSAPVGIRDVTGYHNNLFGTQADWGMVDVPFVRQIAADYSNYVTTPGADYTLGSSVTDYMPRIISRTITTAGVNLLQDANGHFVEWSAAQYASDTAYQALVDAAGVDTSKLVEGAKIVAPLNTEVAVLDANGDPLIWSQTTYLSSMAYAVALAGFANTSFGGLFGSATGGALVEGGSIYYQPVIGTYVQIPGQTYQSDLLVYKQLVDGSGVPIGSLVEGEAIGTTVSASGYGLLAEIGHIDFQNPTSGEYFIGSENPGVAPVNGWFGIFGQFFDHGLDFLGKGGNGTITIALDPNDPLYGTIGSNGQPVTSITVSRATPSGTDANGDAAYVNHTSPFIDQSQTYGSADQITSILREWVSTDNGASYHAGMELFDGTTLQDSWARRWPDGTETQVHDTLPTLNELRAHLLATGRDDLTWEDVNNLRNRDLATGDVITTGPGAGNSGHALLLDMNPHFDGMNAGTGHISTSAIAALNGAFGTNYTPADFSVMAILPYVNGDFSIKADLSDAQHAAVSEILMQSVGDHYIAGDGRVNENFGLTSIHHVFHEEHNYQVENLKGWIYAHDANNPGATDPHEQLHNWQIDTGSTDVNGNFIYANGAGTADDVIAWDPDKMFNATKLIVEMEYQHAAVDQYARTVTPRIQEFVGYSTGVDSSISLEYSQVAFRFGHSTIRETIDTLDPSGWYKGAVMHFALEKAFLAPQTFAAEGAAAITLGLTRQQMNEVDEFITPALNQGLLDQPLDLAAINIARGRDLGIPTLNDFRAGIGLAEYTSWTDFGSNMIHPESLVNFIAAYSFGGDVTKAQYVLDLADGVPVGASPFANPVTAADAIAFLNNNDGVNAELNAARLGFDKIDSWIGGLAEAHVPGGLLGETFDAVFVAQIQSLMDGDRFYYLYRLFGTQIHEEVNNGQFKDIVERNTGLTHLNGSIFAYADKYYDFTMDSDPATGAIDSNHAEHGYADLIESREVGIYSDGGTSTAANGSNITVNGVSYIRDVRPDLHPDLVHPVEGTPTDGADSHEVIVGSQYSDFIHARSGDDTVYGDGGDDIVYGDGGVDRLYGGDGNDLIDTGEGPDLADGGAGKDTIYGRGSGSEVGGFDQLVGGSGNDLIVGGEGIDKLSGGSGDDIIYGDGLTNPEMGNTDPFTHAGDGNDYVDGGASGDILFGEEGDDYIVGGNDQDLMQGGQGDDILRPGNPSQASGTTGGPDEVLGDDGQANAGFDLIDFSDFAANAPGVTVDFATQTNPLVNIDQTTTFPAWFQIEGAIGTRNGDTFIGDSAGDATADNSQGNNWLIGGSGNDVFTGNGGNDVVIGGSIRLDALIGSYAGADFGNLTLGSAGWIADAMQTGGTGSGYADNTENAYTGASNRATGDIGTNGLIDSANALGGAQFDKHFADMLQSRMFKDVMLGDGGTDGTADTAVFTGNMNEYSIEVVNFTAPNGQNIQALKVTDNGGLVDDGTGVLVPRASDGVDLIVGVEKAIFADQPLGVSLTPTQPVLDLDGGHIVTSTTTLYRDNFGAATFNNSDGSTSWTNTPWVETGDNGGTSSATQGQITITNGALRFGDNDTDVGNGTATIQRTVNLAGFTGNATVSYSYNENSFDVGETVTVQFSDDGTFAAGHVQVIQSIDGSSGGGSINNVALLGSLSANSAIRFVVAGTNASSNGDAVTIDNLRFDTTTSTTVAGAAGTGHNASYTEGGSRAPISAFAGIADDSTTTAWAKVVLTNAVAGDALRIGNSNNTNGSLGGGVSYTVDSSVAGQVTLTITGAATKAQYQGFIDQVRFFSTSEDPTSQGTNTARTINVTVNDGLWTSDAATTTVQVTSVNDQPNAGDDYIVTNQTTVVVSEALLMANDTDVDGPNALDITATSVQSNTLTSASLATNPGSVTIVDNGTASGSFSYTVNDGSGAANATDTATVNLTRVTGTGNALLTLNGATGGNANRAEIMIGGAGDDTITAGRGDDIVLAGAGNDTVIWNANNFGSTDGRDFVDGGIGTDSFTVNGNSSNENFVVYARADAIAAGFIGLNTITEIVITRNGGVIAELDNVEEITINTGSGPDSSSSVQVLGNFNGTSLAFNTIHINGGAGDDTVDISGLTSDHRIVFHGGSGSNQVIGTLRPQDVVDNGTPSPQCGTGSSPPPSGDDDDDQDSGTPGQNAGGGTPAADPVHTVLGTADADIVVGGSGDDVLSGLGGDDLILGNDGADTIKGGGGDDLIKSGAGDDVVFGNSGDDDVFGGAGRDLLLGDDGNDRIFGDAGDDTLEGGAGKDVVYAGTGDDHILATSDDGDDIYWGEDGSDTLDYAAISADITANLGSGPLSHGCVDSTQGGHDTVFGFDNFIGGSGNDTIIANNSVNILDGGAGHDTFVFGSAAAANGDIIRDFQPGDSIDLSGIDADTGSAGNQSFVLFAGTGFTAAGQVIVTHETRNGVDHTMVAGNSNGDAAADFTLDLVGNHNVTQADLHGVN